MKNYNEYILTKRFKQKAVCGYLNLPFGTVCFAKNGVIYCDHGAICAVASQSAHDYFTQNDDGCAVQRRKLIDSIFTALNRSKQDLASYDQKWDKVWNDETCLKYKRADYDEYWLWSHDFFNASIETLQYIAHLVGAKEVA